MSTFTRAFLLLETKKHIGEVGDLVGHSLAEWSGGLRVSTSWRMYGPLDETVPEKRSFRYAMPLLVQDPK